HRDKKPDDRRRHHEAGEGGGLLCGHGPYPNGRDRLILPLEGRRQANRAEQIADGSGFSVIPRSKPHKAVLHTLHRKDAFRKVAARTMIRAAKEPGGCLTVYTRLPAWSRWPHPGPA